MVGPETRTPGTRLNRHASLAGAVLFALATLPYLNALHNELVYDDHAVVTENRLVRSLNPQLMLQPSVEQHAVEWYRPLTMYSFAVNYRVGGLDPFGYHLVNVLLHAGNVWLLYSIALRLLARHFPALIAAGLFAVHAVHVEAVTPASGRADLLATLFLLTAWRLALPAERRMTWTRATGIGAAAFAGLLAKESAIVIWPLIALSDLARLGQRQPDQGKPPAARTSRAKVHAALAIAVAGYFGLRMAVTGGLVAASDVGVRAIENPLADLPAASRLATAAWVLVKYCGLLIAPIRLSADYSFNQIPPVSTWHDPRVLLAGLLLAAIATAVVVWRRDRLLATCLLIFVLLWLPISNTLVVIGTIMAERLMYPVSAAFVLLVGIAVARLSHDNTRAKTSLVTATAVVFAVHAGLIVERNTQWRTQETLFRNMVERSPNSAKAHFNYGIALQTAGRHTDAAQHFSTALGIAPRYAEAQNAFGTVLLGRHDLRGAEDRFRTAIAADPRLAGPWINLGTTLFRKGRDDEAAGALQQALRLRPTSTTAHATLGAIAERKGDRAAAIEHYMAAFRLEPRFEGLGPHLAELLTKAGRIDEAKRVLDNLRPAGASR